MTTLPEYKLYIEGQLRDAQNGATYEDIGPWTGEVVGHAPDASPADMEEAIAAARRAFDISDWSTNHKLRRKLVSALGEKLKANRDVLAQLAQHEVGSAMGAVYGPQIDVPLSHFDELVRMFDELEWEKDLGTAEAWGVTSHRIVVREPVGVVGAITPWNVPFYIAVGKVVPALLAGCTVILKPAPETPLINLLLGHLAHEVGFPAGVFNVLTAKDPATIGEMLVTDPRVDLISFTGSTGIGRRIMEKGAPTLKRVFLELGGKSANVVFADTPNFEQAVAGTLLCFHAGQGCAVLSRLLVERSRYDEAVEILKQAYARYSQAWGAFDDHMNIMGPVVSARQHERVLGYIEKGKQEGARLIAGGKAATDKGSGFFIEPTCFVDVTSDMTIAREEIFGPVLVVTPFDDENDAIRIANASDYGLSGAVQSGDRERAMRVARRIRTGTLGVNGGNWSFADVPFGGYKHSGVGREWGMEGFDEYFETKAIGVAV